METAESARKEEHVFLLKEHKEATKIGPLDIVADKALTTCPRERLDFRFNFLRLGHADQRLGIYFISAATGVEASSFKMIFVRKAVRGWWAAEDAFAARVANVGIRPIRGDWKSTAELRSRPTFSLKSTLETTAALQTDDPIVSLTNERSTNAERCRRFECLSFVSGCVPM